MAGFQNHCSKAWKFIYKSFTSLLFFFFLLYSSTLGHSSGLLGPGCVALGVSFLVFRNTSWECLGKARTILGALISCFSLGMLPPELIPRV